MKWINKDTYFTPQPMILVTNIGNNMFNDEINSNKLKYISKLWAKFIKN